MVAEGIDPNFIFIGESLLELAIEKSDKCLCDTLIEAGAKPETLGPARRKQLGRLLPKYARPN